MKPIRIVILAVGALTAALVANPARTQAASCARHRADNVSVSACQIGDDIQVVGHNYNGYSVSFTAKVTYRLKREGEKTRWVEGRLGPDGGGQLDDWRNPDYDLADVTDVEVRNVVQR